MRLDRELAAGAHLDVLEQTDEVRDEAGAQRHVVRAVAEHAETEDRVGAHLGRDRRLVQALATGVRDAQNPALKLVAKAPSEGLYFLMVRADEGDPTAYTVEVMLGAEGEGPGRPDF